MRAAALIVLSLLAGGQTTEDSAVKDLEAIVQRLASTWQKGDCEGWSSMIAPEWSVIHLDGTVLTKAQALEMCRQPQVRMETFTIDQVSVRRFDNAAVVTGRTTIVTAGPDSQTLRLRFTDVFIRRNGTWKAVASQATRLNE